MKTSPEILGMSLKILRSKKLFTQKNVANKTNISRSLIAMYEKGARKVSDHNLNKILKAIGASKEDLDITIKDITG